MGRKHIFNEKNPISPLVDTSEEYSLYSVWSSENELTKCVERKILDSSAEYLEFHCLCWKCEVSEPQRSFYLCMRSEINSEFFLALRFCDSISDDG